VRSTPRAAGRLARPAILLATLCLITATAGSAAARTSSTERPGARPQAEAALAGSHRDTRVIPSASMRALPLKAPVVAMAATPTGQGAWRVGADGGVFTSGNAHYYGSTGGRRLNQPIVGMASTPSGRGYWFVARDGGIFTFGNAHYYGSTGGQHLNQPIVGMIRTRSGHGYWLIARDGGVFSFGDAHFYGSAARSGAKIVGLAGTPTGRGYWMVSNTGRVFRFGDAPGYGDAVSRGVTDVVGIAGTAPIIPQDLLGTTGRAAASSAVIPLTAHRSTALIHSP